MLLMRFRNVLLGSYWELYKWVALCSRAIRRLAVICGKASHLNVAGGRDKDMQSQMASLLGSLRTSSYALLFFPAFRRPSQGRAFPGLFPGLFLGPLPGPSLRPFPGAFPAASPGAFPGPLGPYWGALLNCSASPR